MRDNEFYQVVGEGALTHVGATHEIVVVYVSVDDGVVSGSIFFKNPTGKVIYKHCPPNLRQFVYGKWEALPANEKWREMWYQIKNGKFGVDFLYADQVDVNDSFGDRYKKVVQKFFGNNVEVDYSNP